MGSNKNLGLKFSQLDLNSIECPVCLEVPKPPIFLCISGHSICNLCRVQLTNCPTCRRPISSTQRNFMLEQFVNKNLKVECEFCEKKVNCGDMEGHLKSCNFRSVCCFYNDCHYEFSFGPRSNGQIRYDKYPAHLIAQHGYGMVYNLPSISSIDLDMTLARKYPLGKGALKQVFLIGDINFIVNYLLREGYLIFWVSFIGNETLMEKYIVSLSIYKNNPDKEGVKFYCKMYSIHKSYKDLESEMYTGFKINPLLTSLNMDSGGTIKIQVDIKQISRENYDDVPLNLDTHSSQSVEDLVGTIDHHQGHEDHHIVGNGGGNSSSINNNNNNNGDGNNDNSGELEQQQQDQNNQQNQQNQNQPEQGGGQDHQDQQNQDHQDLDLEQQQHIQQDQEDQNMQHHQQQQQADVHHQDHDSNSMSNSQNQFMMPSSNNDVNNSGVDHHSHSSMSMSATNTPELTLGDDLAVGIGDHDHGDHGGVNLIGGSGSSTGGPGGNVNVNVGVGGSNDDGTNVMSSNVLPTTQHQQIQHQQQQLQQHLQQQIHHQPQLLQQHIPHQGELPGGGIGGQVDDSVDGKTCPVCQEVFEDRDDLAIHRRSHRFSYICSVCKKGMDTKGGLNAHMNTAHVKRPPYVRKKKKIKPPRPHPPPEPPLNIRAPQPMINKNISNKSNHRSPKPPKIPKPSSHHPQNHHQQQIQQQQQQQQQQVHHHSSNRVQQHHQQILESPNVLAAYMSRPSVGGGSSSFQSMIGGASAGLGGQQTYSPPISLTTHGGSGHGHSQYGHSTQNQHFQASSVSQQQNQFHVGTNLSNPQTHQFQQYLSQQHLGSHTNTNLNLLGLPPQTAGLPQTYGHPSLTKSVTEHPEQYGGMYHHHLDPSMQSYGLGYHHLEHGQGGPYSTNN